MVLFFGGLLVVWSVVYGLMALVEKIKQNKENEKLGRIFDRYKNE